VAVKRSTHCLFAYPAAELDLGVGNGRFGVDGDPRAVERTQRVMTHGRQQSHPVGALRQSDEFVVGGPTSIRDLEANPGHLGSKSHDCQRAVLPAIVAHRHPTDRPIAQHVGLCHQAARVVLTLEALAPHEFEGLSQRRQWSHRPFCDAGELGHVVRPARFGTSPHGRLLPPAERLALHDCTGDVPIHIGVANLHALEPAVHFVGIQAVNAAGEAVRRRVLHLDGLRQVVDTNQAEHRTEALGEVEPRTWPYPDTNARRPQAAALVELPWLHQPLLPWFQLAQRTAQCT